MQLLLSSSAVIVSSARAICGASRSCLDPHLVAVRTATELGRTCQWPVRGVAS
jgi:hypothetical protein